MKNPRIKVSYEASSEPDLCSDLREIEGGLDVPASGCRRGGWGVSLDVKAAIC